MPALHAGIHAFSQGKKWMAGATPAMTTHDRPGQILPVRHADFAIARRRLAL
jgi:hypothetical protein